MSKSNEVETKQQIGNQLQIFFWRLPKKNHDIMLQFAKQVNDLFRNYRMQPPEVFQLNSNGKTSDDMGFANIANTVSANQDEEEFWLELHAYRDRKHQDEVGAVMQKDETAGQLLNSLCLLLHQDHA